MTDGEQRRLAFGDVLSRSVSGIEPSDPVAIGRQGMWHGGDDATVALKIDPATRGVITDKLQHPNVGEALDDVVIS